MKRDGFGYAVDIEAKLAEAERALTDLLNNTSCSCRRTDHYPCPRCQLAIDEARATLARIRS